MAVLNSVFFLMKILAISTESCARWGLLLPLGSGRSSAPSGESQGNKSRGRGGSKFRPRRAGDGSASSPGARRRR